MTTFSVFWLLAGTFTVLYVVLAILAFTHVDVEKKSKVSGGLLALTFWWPFYDLYDAEGKQLCKYGKILLPIVVVIYVLIFLI